MTRSSEDDRAAVDRAFADLVAGYHLTSDRPDPFADQLSAEAATATRDDDASTGRADQQPLFKMAEASDAQPSQDPLDPPELFEAEERFVPEPLGPLPKPAWPVLLAWIGMGYAVVAVLAAALGLRLPAFAGWLALIGFVGGFALLVTRLPRHRPPDAGDGAVL